MRGARSGEELTPCLGYCGQYLSAFSEELKSTACKYSCNGNATEVCGGQLALTLYNLTDASKTGTAGSIVSSQPAWYGLAAFVMLVIAAVL